MNSVDAIKSKTKQLFFSVSHNTCKQTISEMLQDERKAKYTKRGDEKIGNRSERESYESCSVWKLNFEEVPTCITKFQMQIKRPNPIL